jgi:hypothetical protein
MFTLISLPPARRLRLQVHSTTRPGLFTKDNVKISGIPVSHKEHTDMLICEVLKNELNIEINMGNIDRSHRVGQKKPNLNRPIAVRFINYRLKEHVYANRMYLRKGYYINESLSKGRSSLFYKETKVNP